MTWTDERIEALREYWRAGLSCSQIAKRMGGVTRNAVIGKVHRLGLSGRIAANSDTKANRRKGLLAQRDSRLTKSPGAAPHLRPAPPQVSATPPSDGAEPPLSNYPNRVPLIETGSGRCKWPLWDDSSAHRDCCGAPTEGFGPYCKAHAVRCFNGKPVKTKPPAPNVAYQFSRY